MNGHYKKIVTFKEVMIVLAGLILAACGSSGDGINLDTGGGSGVCGQLTSVSITKAQATLTSADERVVITVPEEIFGDRNNSLSIQVDCTSRTQLIGRSYIVVVGATLGFNISVSFTESDVAGIDRSRLQLGTFDTSNGIWTTVQDSGPDASPNTFSGNISGITDFAVFGIYATGGGGSGSPPSAPTNVSASPSTTSCRIDVSWAASQDPDGDLQSYIVFRDSTNIGTIAANTCLNTCTFRDSNLIVPPLLQGVYRYFIRATDVVEHSTDSTDSNVVQAPLFCPAF